MVGGYIVLLLILLMTSMFYIIHMGAKETNQNVEIRRLKRENERLNNQLEEIKQEKRCLYCNGQLHLIKELSHYKIYKCKNCNEDILLKKERMMKNE
jgi:hypothetical protein